MNIEKQVADIFAKHQYYSAISPEAFADQIIPLVRADTLKSISKESKRMDGIIYLVPDYTKFREAIKEAGIREEG